MAGGKTTELIRQNIFAHWFEMMMTARVIANCATTAPHHCTPLYSTYYCKPYNDIFLSSYLGQPLRGFDTSSISFPCCAASSRYIIFVRGWIMSLSNEISKVFSSGYTGSSWDPTSDLNTNLSTLSSSPWHVNFTLTDNLTSNWFSPVVLSATYMLLSVCEYSSFPFS